jgi:hypothetical protein
MLEPQSAALSAGHHEKGHGALAKRLLAALAMTLTPERIFFRARQGGDPAFFGQGCLFLRQPEERLQLREIDASNLVGQFVALGGAELVPPSQDMLLVVSA